MGNKQTTPTYRVWLGYRASIWSHNGYVVRGDDVLCEDRADAERVVCRTFFGVDMVSVNADDGTYFYLTQEDADADDTGANAAAVICRWNPDRQEDE